MTATTNIRSRKQGSHRDHSLVQNRRAHSPCELPLLKGALRAQRKGKKATPLAELRVDVTGAAAAAWSKGAAPSEALGETCAAIPSCSVSIPTSRNR